MKNKVIKNGKKYELVADTVIVEKVAKVKDNDIATILEDLLKRIAKLEDKQG